MLSRRLPSGSVLTGKAPPTVLEIIMHPPGHGGVDEGDSTFYVPLRVATACIRYALAAKKLLRKLREKAEKEKNLQLGRSAPAPVPNVKQPTPPHTASAPSPGSVDWVL